MTASKNVLSVPPAATRSLRIYALDPLEVGHEGNIITVEVPFEPLAPGPVGERIEVIDFDPIQGCFYQPVDLDHRHILAQDGLPPSESDPRFHQQMVYAVVMTTLRRFETALGRPVDWGIGRRRLRVYPHGSQEVNAYFSPEYGALVFGYFRASKTQAGRNLPGGHVFTCLSHDIIAHETSHALVHGLRDKFMEPSNPDTPAFHEAFADLVAIFQHFTLPGVVENAVQVTGARLDDVTHLVQLGRQLGDAIGVRGTLRAALGQKPDPRQLDRMLEPHERGSILVAAVFSAMLTVYRRRTRDLLRIATGGSGILPEGDVAPDLVRRLAQEARRSALHFQNICIRALDYCPPVDIEFGEFLRAMVTADADIAPDDRFGYRSAIIESFRERGIYPKFAFSLAEESVLWRPFDGTLDTRGIDFDEIRFDQPFTNRREARRYRKLLHEFVSKKRNREAFQLMSNRPIHVTSVQPLRRIQPDRQIRNEIVVEVLQQGPRLSRYDGAPPFRVGATIIMGEGGEVRYVIFKKFSKTRLERQRQYLSDLAAVNAAHAYRRPMVGMSFSRLHRGL